MKKVRFLETSREDLRAFDAPIRKEFGRQIQQIQKGEAPRDWKPMTAVGRGVREIRERDETGAYRVLYVADIGGEVVVLHAFQKKTQKTPKRHLDLARKRLKDFKAT